MAAEKKLNLKQWAVAVGIESWDLAKRAGVTAQTLREAEDPYGHGISLRKAQKLCEVLSEEHGSPITVADVRDLKTI